MNELQLAATVPVTVCVVVPTPSGLVPVMDKALPLIVPVKRLPSDPCVASNGTDSSNAPCALTVLPLWDI